MPSNLAPWRKTVLVIFGIILVLAFTLGGLSEAFRRATEAQTLRTFVVNVAVSRGDSQAEAEVDFNQKYYKSFACGDVLRCIQRPPPEGLAMVLVSQTGHLFFRQFITYTVITALLTVIIILFTATTRASRVLGIGVPTAIAGLNVFLKPITQNTLLRTVPQDTSTYVQALIENIFTASNIYFIILLCAGILLVIVGLSLAWKEEKRSAREHKSLALKSSRALGKKIRREESKKRKLAIQRARQAALRKLKR